MDLPANIDPIIRVEYPQEDKQQWTADITQELKQTLPNLSLSCERSLIRIMKCKRCTFRQPPFCKLERRAHCGKLPVSAALTKDHPEARARVEIGMQKWFDKAAVAAIALVLSAGMLLALPALGAYWQYKITEDSWKIIEDHIARKAGGYVPPMPGRCGTCGAANAAGAAFCSSCGANMRIGLSCSACGAVQKDSAARFCNSCGKALAT